MTLFDYTCGLSVVPKSMYMGSSWGMYLIIPNYIWKLCFFEWWAPWRAIDNQGQRMARKYSVTQQSWQTSCHMIWRITCCMSGISSGICKVTNSSICYVHVCSHVGTDIRTDVRMNQPGRFVHHGPDIYPTIQFHVCVPGQAFSWNM